MTKIFILKELIDNIINYLQPFLPLGNYNMVNYFCKDTFKQHVPKNIQEEVMTIGCKEVIQSIYENSYANLPNLKQYVEQSQKFTLKNCQDVCMGIDDLQEKLQEWGAEELQKLKLPYFMSPKKSHEVEILSFIAATIKNIFKTSHLIDIGDGKGYLSSMLALHYKIPVLGVDASEINTDGAVKRINKLSKLWNSIVNNEKQNSKVTVDLYKQVTQYVDEDSNFSNLISTVFLESPTHLGLVGLHTCGNLASNSLKIFANNEDIKTICNVGCCYHLIHEKFNIGNFEQGDGFPMSEYLTQKKVALGKGIRMIANQPIERILDKKQLPSNTLFHRALLEILLDENCPEIAKDKRQIGKFKKECVDFPEYVQKASKRIKITQHFSNETIQNLFMKYKDRQDELNVFYLIRNMLAPIIESLILLDRLLFLKEQKHDNSHLVQLFNPVVSPRCYGIIAIK